MALLNMFSLDQIKVPWKAIADTLSGIFLFVRQAAVLPLLLPLLVYIGAKSYLHYTAVSVVEQALAVLPEGVQLSVEDIDSHFDGVVDLNGASLLLEGMSLPVRFDTLQLVNDSWRALPVFATMLDQGQLPHRTKLRFQVAESELALLTSAEWLPTDKVRQLLGCYQYKVPEGVSNDRADARFTGGLAYRFDPASEYLNAELKLAAPERFQLELKVDLDIAAPQLERAGLAHDKVGLGGAELQFFNLGSQTRLLNECGAFGRSGLVQGKYVARQSRVVKQGLQQQGWLASTELELAYQDYLFLPVQLKLQLSSPYAVRLDQLRGSAAGWGKFSLRLGLNPSDSQGMALRWQPGADRLAAAPVVVPSSVVPEVISPNDTGTEVAQPELATAPRNEAPRNEASRNEPLPRLDQAVVYQPSYKPVTPRQLAGLLGAPLKLTTLNGRQLEGVLDALESDRLQLRREDSRGFAVVPVRLESISGLLAYF